MSGRSPLRVGIVMPLAEQRGGAELALMHYLAGIEPALRADFHVCYLEDGPLAQWTSSRGFPTLVLHSGRVRQAFAWARCVGALRRWLTVNRLQVVVSWMTKAHLYVGPAALIAGVPAVWWQHGVPRSRGFDLAATLLPARLVLTCSNAAADAQARVFGQRARLRTIYPPVDLEYLARSERAGVSRQELGLPGGKLIVGIVARMQRWKGIHVLLDAARELAAANGSLFFVVVGGVHSLEPAYAEGLRAQVRDLGLESCVHFTGHQSDPARWMAQMDIVVSASLGEPFGMVIVEAMALGKAVIATRTGGPLEIIRDGVDGLLVTPGAVAELVQAVRRLAADPPLRVALGARARARAQAYAVPRFVSEVMSSLQEIAT